MKQIIAIEAAAKFETEILVPKLEQALESGEVPAYLEPHLQEAIRISKAGGNVRAIGNRMISQVALLLALDMSLNDEQLKIIPGLGVGKVEKIREIQKQKGEEN